jgi:hypothetical protein
MVDSLIGNVVAMSLEPGEASARSPDFNGYRAESQRLAPTFEAD